jgi:hypothetical protein
MTCRPTSTVIGRDECAIDLGQTLSTILQSLCDVVRVTQLRFLVEEDIELGPDAVAGVIGL